MAQSKLVGNPKIQRFQLWLLRLLMKLLLRVEVANTGLVPRSGPVVVVINHVGYDAPLVAEKPEWFHQRGNTTDWSDAEQRFLPDRRRYAP